MWFMEEPSQFSEGQTAQSLTCSIMDKQHTGLDDCQRKLLPCFSERMSVVNCLRVWLCWVREWIEGGGAILSRSFAVLPTNCKSHSPNRALLAPHTEKMRGASAASQEEEGDSRNLSQIPQVHTESPATLSLWESE